jgi:CHAD domain-containing protein
MFQTRFLRLFDKYGEAVRSGCAEATSAQATEAFHRLRVGIKKLRALLALAESMDPELEGGKLYKRLRPLFRAAAPARDFQVQRALAEKQAENLDLDISEYLLELGTRAEESVEDFLKAARKFDGETLENLRRRVSRSLNSINDVAAAALAKARMRALMQSISDWPSGDGEPDPHELRTMTKQAFFSWEAIDETLPHTLNDPRTKRRLRSLQRVLGNWHDHHVAGGMLERYREKSGDKSEELEKLLASFRDDETRLLKRSLAAKNRLQALSSNQR